MDADERLRTCPQTCRRRAPVDYQTEPSRYRHWSLSFDGPVATLAMDVAEDGGIRPGYKLKLNSYDLGVDIELARRAPADPLRASGSARRRDHERAATACSARAPTSSCSACRRTRGRSTSASSPTRRATASRTRAVTPASSSSPRCNGTAPAAATSWRSPATRSCWSTTARRAVSLPEVPLLGVLPGTGGLTRLTDKRKVRRDLADIFCTTTRRRPRRAREGLAPRRRGREAAAVRGTRAPRARELAARERSPGDARGRAAAARAHDRRPTGYHYEHVDVEIDRAARLATLTVRAPRDPQPVDDRRDHRALGAPGGRSRWRASSTTRSCCCAPTSSTSAPGSARRGRRRARARGRRTLATLTRALVRARDDRPPAPHARAPRRLVAHAVRARSNAARASRARCSSSRWRPTAATCWPPADDAADRASPSPTSTSGSIRRSTARSRLDARFYGETEPLAAARRAVGKPLDAGRRPGARPRHRGARRHRLGRRGPHRARGARVAVARRADRAWKRTCASAAARPWRRGSSAACRAWQNWIFIRPNAVGENGALKLYGKGDKPQFDWKRGSGHGCTTSTTARRSRTTSTSPRTRRCSARSSTGSRTTSTGGTTWARSGSQNFDVYLRTAVSVEPQGWAHFDYVKMPDYRWGIFLSPQRADRARSTSASTRASRPGRRCPASIARTCAASSSRRATPSPRRSSSSATSGAPRPSLYDLRNLFQVNVEEGRHLWAMVYLLHRYFGRDGREEAEALLAAPLGRRRQPAHPRRVQRADARLAVRSSCSRTSPIATASSSSARSPRSGFDPLARTTKFMLTEEAHHMFVGESGVSRVVAAHVRGDERASRPTIRRRCAPRASIDLPTIQRYLNFHYSVTIDLFGADQSSNAATFYSVGPQGALRGDEARRRSRAEGRRPTRCSTVADGRLVEREVPMLNALNEVLRDDFIKDSIARRRALEQGHRESRPRRSACRCRTRRFIAASARSRGVQRHARRPRRRRGEWARARARLAADRRRPRLRRVADGSRRRAAAVRELDRAAGDRHQPAAARFRVRALQLTGRRGR